MLPSIEMAYLLFTPSGVLADLDGKFNAKPFRDRKWFSDLIWGPTLKYMIVKHLALEYVKYLSEDKSAPVPTDDAAELANFTLKLVGPPLTKEIAIVATARLYEHVLIDKVHKSDDNKAGSFIRG